MSAARYLIAKYIPDLFRGEPENIGVVLWSPAGIAARFIAERPDYSGQVYAKSIPQYVISPSAYRQWVQYWREQIIDAMEIPFVPTGRGNGLPAVEFLEELAQSSKGNFVLVPGGELLDQVAEPQDAADYLFETLVETPEKSKKRTIATVCNTVIRKFELNKDKNFKPQHVVNDIIVDGVRDVMKFSYAYQNGALHRLYQRVQLSPKDGVVDDGVHATAWKFRQMESGGRLAKDAAVSLVLLPPGQRSEFDRSPAGELLQSVSRLVNVGNTAEAEAEFGSLAALSQH